MLKVNIKTILWWICPECSRRNEIEDRVDGTNPDELECGFCSHVDDWEIEEY